MEGNSTVPTGAQHLSVRGKAAAAAHLADLIMQMWWLLPSCCHMTQSRNLPRNTNKVREEDLIHVSFRNLL